jgi:heme-degrading monooxygenase HmoA
MHVQVVTYALEGIQEREYLDISNELAPSFSNVPGLQAKIWLDDPERGRYGAVYFWDDKESMDRFLRSNLFEGTNTEFTDVESEGFAILENLTAQTQPVLDIVQTRGGPEPASIR